MDWSETLKLLSIPLIAGLVGWITNWLAIQLTFYPLEFRGFKPWLGWQGIIPSKAEKMATLCVDSTLSRIGTVSEIIEQMDPDSIGEHILLTLEGRVEELVDELMLTRHRTLWQNLPRPIKHLVYERVRHELPNTVESLVEELGPKIESLFDLKLMVIQHLEQDKALLNRIFLECGQAEFKFLIRSGLIFGALFGLPQLALWYFYPVPWLLPLCGFLVGWLTNWLALNLIFRPVNPVSVFKWNIQGLFLQRQDEVSETFCMIITDEILTVSQIANAMLTGPYADRTRNIIQRHFENLVDDAAGVVKPLTQVALGAEKFAELKRDTGLKAIDLSQETLQDPLFNRQRAEVVREIMSSRMRSLPSVEFQNLLRPCFQEDELKLIMIGGVLGAMAGTAQLIFVFGQSLF